MVHYKTGVQQIIQEMNMLAGLDIVLMQNNYVEMNFIVKFKKLIMLDKVNQSASIILQIFILRSLERSKAMTQSNETSQNSYCQLQTNDSNMLSRLVAARLDLSSSQSLLDQHFKLSVIKRSWEDQLQLKSK